MARNDNRSEPSSSSVEKKYSPRILRELARSERLKNKGKNEEALEIAQKILAKDPSCVLAAEEVADNLAAMQKTEEAALATDFVLQLDAKSHIGNYLKGFLLLGEGKNAEALPFLETANISHPSNPEILRCLGWALYHTEKKLEGVVTLERALNMRPHDPLILCDLGVCQLHEENYTKAINLFEQALVLDPENERVQGCLSAAEELILSLEAEKQKMV